MKFDSMDLKEAMKVLGIKAGFGVDQVKAAYRKRAMEEHPDHGGTGFEQVKEAYDILMASLTPQREGSLGRGRRQSHWKRGNPWREKILREVMWELRMHDGTDKACQIVEAMLARI